MPLYLTPLYKPSRLSLPLSHSPSLTTVLGISGAYLDATHFLNV